MRPNFLRCELKLNEVAPVLLAGGRLKKKKNVFVFFLSLSTPAVVVDNKIVLSGSFPQVHYSLSLPVSACLSVCTFYSLWSAHYTCTVLLRTQHAQKSKQSRYNMKRSIVDYFKERNGPEETKMRLLFSGATVHGFPVIRTDQPSWFGTQVILTWVVSWRDQRMFRGQFRYQQHHQVS